MTDGPINQGWFETADDRESAIAAISEGSAAGPERWPAQAIESGFAEDEADYYDQLHEITVEATRREVTARESADDQQLIHAIRAMDDCHRTVNELTERVAEWAGTHDADATVDIDYICELASQDPDDPVEMRLISLAQRVVALDDETDDLRQFIERSASDIAPNLSAIAGPELAARLISLAGGLDELAKKPSGTVQLLGAENALFAHLQGGAPSPKHGLIYTHEYVRGTHPDNRGSAARALAGKLSIAARIDHYSGDYRPNLERELADRIERIRARDTS